LNSINNISIIGLGLIGGSLCRVFKSSDEVSNVVGVDTDATVVNYAKDNGFVDQATCSLAKGVEEAELVVICTYVDSIAEIASELYDIVPEGCVITDVGSVKEDIVRRIDDTIGENIFFVGGHPIAGTENSGIQHAYPELFRGKNIYLTPSDNTDRTALEKVTEMWEKAGGTVSEIPPFVHDRIFAMVSHLPHVVAYSLINCVGSVKDIENIFQYSGGGLKDYTRIASSSPAMWKEIFGMNRKNVLDAIKSFRISMQEIENAIESGDSGKLLELLESAATMTDKFRRN